MPSLFNFNFNIFGLSVRGGDGRDNIEGRNVRDVIYGGGGNDSLFGRGDDDALFGDNGNDRLYGGSGDDYLRGGAGQDILSGGSGGDTFAFAIRKGDVNSDIITDYDASQGDRITVDDLNLVQGLYQNGNDVFMVVYEDNFLTFDVVTIENTLVQDIIISWDLGLVI